MQQLFASLDAQKIDIERQSRIRREALRQSGSKEITGTDVKKGPGDRCGKNILL